jgi:hypothetical protein
MAAEDFTWRHRHDELNAHFLNAVKYYDVDEIRKYIEAGCDVNIQSDVTKIT